MKYGTSRKVVKVSYIDLEFRSPCLTRHLVSIGISHNIFLAKLATRAAKPAGVYHLVPDQITEFLAPLDVADFPSVGYSIRSRIEDKFGTSNAGELLAHSQGAFRALLGQKTGEMVYGYLRGIDTKKIEAHKERKSISAEMNVSSTPWDHMCKRADIIPVWNTLSESGTSGNMRERPCS